MVAQRLGERSVDPSSAIRIKQIGDYLTIVRTIPERMSRISATSSRTRHLLRSRRASSFGGARDQPLDSDARAD